MTINLVVNTGEGRICPLLQYHHGSAVCALGLEGGRCRGHVRSGDPAARSAVPPAGRAGRARDPCGARRRRQPRLFPRYEERAGAGMGHRVRGHGRGSSNAAGLIAVDHISQSMHYEEMLTWLLFYTSLLDVTKTPHAGRRRPRRARQEPGDRVRRRRHPDHPQCVAEPAHPVVAVPGARCSARACSTSLSPPPIMLATVARLKRNGLQLLPIPENYYDDLEAKTDLPPERIASLQGSTTYSTTETGTASTCRSTPKPSSSASSSRSSSAGTATVATVPPTRRSGSRPRRG